jgi:hypothetical protein
MIFIARILIIPVTSRRFLLSAMLFIRILLLFMLTVLIFAILSGCLTPTVILTAFSTLFCSLKITPASP